MENEGVIGLLSFLSFGFSVIAAVLAIDTYALLRTGQSGGTWRVLIIASVIFALMHALRLSEILNFSAFNKLNLSEVVELVFVMALTYAFYLQRRIFQGKPTHTRRAVAKPDTREDDRKDDSEDGENDQEIEPSSNEWARLNGLPTSDDFRPSHTDEDGEAIVTQERRTTDRRSGERRNS